MDSLKSSIGTTLVSAMVPSFAIDDSKSVANATLAVPAATMGAVTFLVIELPTSAILSPALDILSPTSCILSPAAAISEPKTEADCLACFSRFSSSLVVCIISACNESYSA